MPLPSAFRNKTAAGSTAEEDRPGLKMSELVRATGAPKSTILHYLDAGLLPKPVKTSPNMSYYSPRCVDLIRLIKSLQSLHRLSLAEIREVLDRGGDDPAVAAMMILGETIFGHTDGPLLDRAGFLEATGLSEDQALKMETAGLLMPLEPEAGYDDMDVAMGQVLADGLAKGLEADWLEFYPRLGKQMVDAEMALRDRLTGHLSDVEDAVTTAELTRGARLMRGYVIDRLFQHRVAASTSLKDRGLLT